MEFDPLLWSQRFPPGAPGSDRTRIRTQLVRDNSGTVEMGPIGIFIKWEWNWPASVDGPVLFLGPIIPLNISTPCYYPSPGLSIFLLLLNINRRAVVP